MIFTATPLLGAFVVELQPLEHARRLFARTWSRREMEAHGLEADIASPLKSQSLAAYQHLMQSGGRNR